nr:uncharacterized protein LOC105731711 [Aotus nancymaae]
MGSLGTFYISPWLAVEPTSRSLAEISGDLRVLALALGIKADLEGQKSVVDSAALMAGPGALSTRRGFIGAQCLVFVESRCEQSREGRMPDVPAHVETVSPVAASASSGTESPCWADSGASAFGGPPGGWSSGPQGDDAMSFCCQLLGCEIRYDPVAQHVPLEGWWRAVDPGLGVSDEETSLGHFVCGSWREAAASQRLLEPRLSLGMSAATSEPQLAVTKTPVALDF